MINPEDMDILTGLCRAYGTYRVTQALLEIGRQACETTYADNEEAVIHRDTATLVEAVDKMRQNHPLRG